MLLDPQHKGDQEGKHSAPKHVYANSGDSLICPILSLAIFIFTEGQRFNGGNHCLFGNPNNENHRFSKWLNGVLEDHKLQLEELGIVIDDIGTNSFRKGIAQFLAGLIGGPNAIAIYLRAGFNIHIKRFHEEPVERICLFVILNHRT